MEANLEGIDLIAHCFPGFTKSQLAQMQRYASLLIDQNQRVNLISRKNEARVWEEHLLHSLGIAKVVSFVPNASVLDFGTGGGLPGIPLAIAFPQANFLLVDSIGKKVRAVAEMASELGLSNVRTQHCRVEELNQVFDFAVSRAVTALPTIEAWLKKKIRKGNESGLPNGLVYIKGGDFVEELTSIKKPFQVWQMADWFEDPFFETKKVVWIQLD